MGVEKIHACPNYCILYRGDTFKDLDTCPVCSASRYKNNPFGDRTSNNSTWPVILMMYNLSTWLCQKRKYLLLSILIQGPKHPSIDIDVFLKPLMQEMETLWKKGINIFDGFTQQTFNLRGIIFVSIHDYQALFVLSGQIKGRTGCTVCVDDTVPSFLEGSRKVVYLGYRHFLVEGHWYQSKKFYNLFDGKPKLHSALVKQDRHYIFEMVGTIQVTYGKMTKAGKKRNRDKPPIEGVPFKKQSIFYKYLLYWVDLEVRHAIDDMHLKKNVFGNTIGLLLETSAKTKNTLKSHQDLVAMKIREDLHPIDKENGRYELPLASYNLTQDDKKAMCESLRGIRVPNHFSSNIRKLVLMKDLSLCVYNCHDCYMLLTVFLPIAIRVIKPAYVKMVITQLCYFFNKISVKVIDEDELQDLQEFIRETMAQLDMCFPPRFFDTIERLMIHMVDPIHALVPLYLHKMWTYEHFMSILNRYVQNRAYPDGAMIEGYYTEEIILCCLGYLKDKIGIGLPVPCFLGRLEGVGIVGSKTFIDKDFKDVQQAHYSILQHLTIMTPLIDQHLSMIHAESNGRSNDWIMREHKH
jgi:hypothetical protein